MNAGVMGVLEVVFLMGALNMRFFISNLETHHMTQPTTIKFIT